jgi:two-component system response regulator AtoC
MVRIEMKLGEHTLGDIENTLIEEVMRVSDFNKSLAAKHLGITRFALDRRLKKQSDS